MWLYWLRLAFMSKTISNTEKRESTSTPKFRLQTFRALRYRDYRLRGRVMSLNTLLIMGLRPLGDFPAGALIALIGGAVYCNYQCVYCR